MGLSLDDCKRLGIPLELHPATSGRSEGDVLRERFGIGEEVPPSKATHDGMNKTERAFAETVASDRKRTDCYVKQCMREALTFRLAGKTRYTPDFVIELIPFRHHDNRLVCVEVKGYMRDDAAVKIKVAAELYPQFRWLLVKRASRHDWHVREVTRRGIGTFAVRVPWIHGG